MAGELLPTMSSVVETFGAVGLPAVTARVNGEATVGYGSRRRSSRGPDTSGRPCPFDSGPAAARDGVEGDGGHQRETDDDVLYGRIDIDQDHARRERPHHDRAEHGARDRPDPTRERGAADDRGRDNRQLDERCGLSVSSAAGPTAGTGRPSPEGGPDAAPVGPGTPDTFPAPATRLLRRRRTPAGTSCTRHGRYRGRLPLSPR